MRRMETLIDANHALTNDVPRDVRKQKHWLRAGALVVEAAETGTAESIRFATEALVEALELEGWMSHGQAKNAAP